MAAKPRHIVIWRVQYADVHERTLVSLSKEFEYSDFIRAYINRLSDLLFVVCRVLSREAGEGEVYWQSERIKSK